MGFFNFIQYLYSITTKKDLKIKTYELYNSSLKLCNTFTLMCYHLCSMKFFFTTKTKIMNFKFKNYDR